MFRVLVVSDIRLYREGIAHLLAGDGRLEVGGTVASVEGALRYLKTEKIHVVVLDMGMPEGLICLQTVAGLASGIKSVALGIEETRSDVLTCAEAGAQGYVCQESSLEDLVEAVVGAVEGKLHCPPAISAALMDGVGRLAARTAAIERIRLTCRELEVAELIDAGLPNREIADRLHIALSTVKVHVHNLLDKLDVHHRGAAVAKLRRHGLLRLSRKLECSR